jgi:hypothetical protein
VKTLKRLFHRFNRISIRNRCVARFGHLMPRLFMTEDGKKPYPHRLIRNNT